jgi:menaquinone-specific isochorismate synthase
MQYFDSNFLHCGTLMSLGNGKLMIGWGPRQWAEKPSTEPIPSFYFPDFFLRQATPWFYHPHWQEMTITELAKRLGNPIQCPPMQWETPGKQIFLDTVADLQKRFQMKGLSKAVPFTFSTTNTVMTPAYLHQCLSHLLHFLLSHDGYPLQPYGFWDKSEGMLGATPELLCSLSNDTHSVLHTVALAGTQSKTSSPDLLQNNPKEQHEHQLVVEGICQSLAPFGKTTIKAQSVLELPTLYHLMTPIEATLNRTYSLKDLIEALHPTPALGAFPREAGARWLDTIQQQIDRRRFGAPVGVMHHTHQTSTCWVAIRNMQWDAEGMAIGAGCGIVPQSDPEKEWNELMLKIRATKNYFAIE